MSVVILDAGNSVIKAKIARRERGEIAFPHALKPLTETEYKNIISRSGKQTSLQCGITCGSMGSPMWWERAPKGMVSASE